MHTRTHTALHLMADAESSGNIMTPHYAANCKLPLRGRVFIRPFAFKTILFINPPCYLTICFLFWGVFVVLCFMFLRLVSLPATFSALICQFMFVFFLLPLKSPCSRMNSVAREEKAPPVENCLFCFLRLFSPSAL